MSREELLRSAPGSRTAAALLTGAVLLPLVAAGGAQADAPGQDPFSDPPAAEILVLGETHDNPVHHANQARGVEAAAPRAIVFEMLTAEPAGRITPALRQDAEALGAALEWEESGWPDFSMYYPIFTAAPSAQIYGAARPRDEVRRALEEGAAAVFGEEAERFTLAQPLDPAVQAAREAEQMTAHCNALPETRLSGMVEAQRLRDAALAQTALIALEETGGPVVVITGGGHARNDWGVPWVLSQAAPEVGVVSIGQVEGDAEAAPPYTLTVSTLAMKREDPCEAFTMGG